MLGETWMDLSAIFVAKFWMPLYFMEIFIVLTGKGCLTQNASRPQEIQEEH